MTLSLAQVTQAYTDMLGVVPADMNRPGPAYWLNQPGATVRDMYFAAMVNIKALLDETPVPTPAHGSIVQITWPANTSVAGPIQSIRDGEVKAFRFVMPARVNATTQTVYASVPKYISLSREPYDFGPGTGACSGLNNPIIWNSTTGQLGMLPVVEGATYYLNVRNATRDDDIPEWAWGMHGDDTFYVAW